MTRRPWLARFSVKGVFWRQILRWAVLNNPPWLEPIVMMWWSFFFLLWGPGRRGVMRNLSAILPGSTRFGNFLRTYRVFWNYAWTITDAVRFRELRTDPDWHFEGWEHYQSLRDHPGGAILLTAHMGNYDLGARVFAMSSERAIVMVRAPEIDPETRAYEEHAHASDERYRVAFNTRADIVALELLDAIGKGELIAIQGDRATAGVSTLPATLFGKKVAMPSGPFALAMVAKAPIYPLFIIREGRRRYRLLACPPITVLRTSRDREEDFARAIAEWTTVLEGVVRKYWFQWFAFEPYSEELS